MFDPTSHQSFLRGILAEPDNDSPRLIYADWLNDRGEVDRAEFIRLQIRLAGLRRDDAAYRDLFGRADELLRTHHVEWTGQLPQFREVNWEVFERGFISAVKFDSPDAYFAYAADVMKAAPIREVRLHQFYMPNALKLAESRHLDHIKVLDLNDGNLIGNSGVEALLRSKHLSALQSLKLGRNSLGGASARAIADSGYVRNLRLLRLERNDLYDDGLRFLSGSRALAQLVSLDLDRTRTGNDGIAALAKTRYLTQLRTLHLSYNFITDTGLIALARSSAMSELQDLYLQGNSITDESIEVLAVSPHFAKLERVFLRQNKVGDAGARALLHSPFLENLRELYLGGNRISDQAGDELRLRFGNRVNLH